MGGKVKETSLPQREEGDHRVIASMLPEGSSERGPDLAEVVQKESFARHLILDKPSGPRVGNREDGSWHQELAKA